MAEAATATNGAAATNGAGETAAAETPAPDVGLLDVLDSLPAAGADAEKATPEKPKPAKSADVKSEPEEKSAPKPDPEDALDLDESLISDEALSSKGGVERAAEIVKAAAAAVKQRNRILDKYDIRIKKRDERTKADAESLKSERETARQQWESEIAPQRQAAAEFVRELQILAPNSGATAVDRLNALGRIVRMDGRQFYDDISVGIATDGKVPAPSRAEAALRSEIDQLKSALQQKLQGDESAKSQAERSRLESGIAGHLSEIATLAKDAEKYPEIAARVADADDDGETMAEVVEWVKGAMLRAAAAGKPLDKATAIGKVEARLARLSGGRVAEAAETAESGASEKPGSPARGAGKGTTVLPTSADRSTGLVREPKNQRERDAENLRDPAFRAALPILFGD